MSTTTELLTATGESLDVIGVLLSKRDDGEDDASYRCRLVAKWALAHAPSSSKSIEQAVRSLPGVANVACLAGRPGSFNVVCHGGDLSRVAAVVENRRMAGVAFRLVHWPVEGGWLRLKRWVAAKLRRVKSKGEG